ncbi:histidine kinase [Streptomyces sp. KL116D]|uniref:histidine kinase n=1 Tax=Streptomyces sp. KL116D TaxID=3045152 RepID=UPI0035576A11
MPSSTPSGSAPSGPSTREERPRRRVAEERLRIARDLHDVVAHTSPWSACRPGSPPTIMDKRPDQAKEALCTFARPSRSALNELGRPSACCGRPATREAPTEPAPGLDRPRRPRRHLHGTRASRSRWPCAGAPPPLPAAVDLAAFRVVQER